ncbi:MAG: hypothetical protein J0H64_09085, partial [Actinobacteria bacterium]|nr:hypothetical protein [Actinomycetota bacterium]
TAVTPSILPSGGAVDLTVSVRNLTKRKLPGTVEFWISTPWGSRASSLPVEKLKPLAPGETRTLTARLEGPGQWTAFTAHAVFTPPSVVDKLDTPAQVRTEFFLVPPFFALAALAVLLLGSTVIRLALRRRGTSAVVEPPGAEPVAEPVAEPATEPATEPLRSEHLLTEEGLPA